MTKDEMRRGLAAGRRLVQEEWADPDEIRAVDELVAAGEAAATPWEYRDGFQGERRIVTLPRHGSIATAPRRQEGP